MRLISRIALLLSLAAMTVTSASAQQNIGQYAQRFVQNTASRLVNSTVGGALANSTAGGARAVAQNIAQASSSQSSAMLPSVATSSVDLNTCDMDFIGGKSRPSAGDGGGGDGSSGGVNTAGYPPSPGPGYQPMTQHGQFVGWYSPDEVAESQTDFPDALVSILKSDRYYGGIEGAASILYEIGKISSPFAFDEAAAFLGK